MFSIIFNFDFVQKGSRQYDHCSRVFRALLQAPAVSVLGARCLVMDYVLLWYDGFFATIRVVSSCDVLLPWPIGRCHQRLLSQQPSSTSHRPCG